jgi:tetratricopeptide (TPR) repeat protein
MAPLLAIRCEFDAARESVRRALAYWRDAGVLAPEMPDWLAEASVVELVAGDWDAAERALRIQCEQSERPGREPVLATAAAMLAHCLLEQGRDDEADRWATRAEEIAPVHDPNAQVLWRSARAKLLARTGSTDRAKTLARDAVARAERTDWIWGQADAYMDLAEVLADEPEERADALAAALALYERKEHLVGAERARLRLAEFVREAEVQISGGSPRLHAELRELGAARIARDRGDELARLERVE